MLNKLSILTQIEKLITTASSRLPSPFNKKNWRIHAACTLCNQKKTGPHAICHFCYSLLRPLGTTCPICAIPLPDDHSVCRSCRDKKPFIDRVITAYHYEEPLRTLLHQFKYHDGLYLTSFLVDLMLQAPIDHANLTCLIPVPLHRKRLQERGFNQASILAQRLSKILGIPYLDNSCLKTTLTLPQAGLSGRFRQTNLANSFKSKPIAYSQVTLVDDLLTTGNTANEIGKTLKQQGIRRVDIWCCARTVFNPLPF